MEQTCEHRFLLVKVQHKSVREHKPNIFPVLWSKNISEEVSKYFSTPLWFHYDFHTNVNTWMICVHLDCLHQFTILQRQFLVSAIYGKHTMFQSFTTVSSPPYAKGF